jgi:predicted transport protein
MPHRNIMPLGVGGTEAKVESQDLLASSDIEHADDSKIYALEDYPGLQGPMREVFEHLRKRILNLDSSVREEYKKLYIAYKTTTNFVDIEPQVKRLRLSLNLKFSEINDPKGLSKDITGLGRWGNGDIEVGISSLDQLDDVMDLVRQSFEKHWDEVYA